MTLPLVVGISGATGVVYAVGLLRALRRLGRPTHLIISEMAARTIAIETDLALDDVRGLADVVHSNKDLGAAVASGSFRTAGMVIVPCSVKTLSGIANGYSANLLIRAADVTLKERRPLVIVFRETPLHAGHLRLMLQASEAGAIILPPMPAFYHRPKTLDDIVSQTVGRTLDQLGVDHDLTARWAGG
ncbi:MAG: UbiX family flavin prenyltransferase [Rhodospirillales bacterium]|nr:UbiX family flavin prenyltransferase [Rhodospirillales bacterium]